MKPNLFKYATSELSQDAILCLLLSWADNNRKTDDPILHELGRNFLNSIYQCIKGTDPGSYQSIEIRQQDGGIDILCLINGDTALIIEDKVGTKQHSDQLARYKEHVIQKGFASDKIIQVYLQTRDQSDYSEVTKHGYSVYERGDLLKVLESSAGIAAQEKSDVISSYSSYLRHIENEVQSFRTLPPKDWSWESWKGFYTELQRALEDAKWDYVPNQSGGFLGLWWHFLGNNECDQYLQIEQEKFCFKIHVEDQEKRRELRDHWHNRILEECSRHGLKAKRPDRFGNGYCMTVAILDQDFRIVNDRNQIDLRKTIELLKRAESVLNDINAQPYATSDRSPLDVSD